MNKIMKFYLTLLCLTLAVAASAGSAWANTAANARISNTATLSYNDGTGTKTSTASVSVIVALVPSPPMIIPGTPTPVTYTGPNTAATNSFVVTATSNGPDTYNLSSAVTASTNTTAPGATVTTPSPLALGATVTTVGSTTTSIIVPSDGVADNKINGIVAGSTVVISGQVKTVASIIDNATGTSTINLNTALTGAPAAGIVVAEQKTVTVTVTSGTIITTGTDITVSKNLTATSTTLGTATTTSAPIIDTFTSGVATLTKFVRNASVPVVGTGTPYTYNAANYYQDGVTGKPTDTLEYILVANNSGAAAVTQAFVADVLPTAFVTLKLGAYGGAGADIKYVPDTGPAVTYTAAADVDQATYNAGTSTLTVYIGTGATNSTGGSIPSTKSEFFLYQVTIN